MLWMERDSVFMKVVAGHCHWIYNNYPTKYSAGMKQYQDIGFTCGFSTEMGRVKKMEQYMG